MSTAEEWGRIAVRLPGWRWMPGMLTMWSLDEDPVMPLRLTEDAGAGHPGVSHPVWSGVRSDREYNDHEVDPEWCWPDPDDPATEGCMVRLLGPVHEAVWYTGDCDRWVVAVGEERRLYTSLGRACIAAAEALGRWPNDGRMVAE